MYGCVCLGGGGGGVSPRTQCFPRRARPGS